MKKTVSMIFMAILIGLGSMHILIEDQLISLSERRKLKTFPALTLDTIMSGDFAEDLEDYLLDHMPWREDFKALKAWTDTEVLHKNDVNDYLMYEDHLFKLEYPYDAKSVEGFLSYVEKIQAIYLENNRVFVSVIPDKSYFLEDAYLKLNYEALKARMNQLDHYIDLFPVLTLSDYYKTDPHWRQEALESVLARLSDQMDFEYDPLEVYESMLYENFKGAYAAQSGYKTHEETLYYLWHENFANCIVRDYEDQGVDGIYDYQTLSGMDPYEVFLSGASPLMTIENPAAKTDKELILFRDSFGSSIAPLLINSYAKITLVDTRYVGYEYLDEFIDFGDQDVLFLYSTLVVNNSIMLK